MKLTIFPTTFRQANEFVKAHHRHSKPVQGCKFVLAVKDDSGLIRGVAIAARPVARMMDDGETLEVRRCCTDGAQNCCSMLYRACVRAASAMGYYRVITYTLENESGASLKGAGFCDCGPSGGGSWSRQGRERTDHNTGKKRRWEICAGKAAK